MNQILSYIVAWIKTYEKGNTTTFPDPAPPTDLGDPLTQDEIDFVKKLKKEMDERFNPPPLP